MKDIKKVFVIHKTHLDIGFTAMSQEVLDRYTHQFIPQAIETANACNQNGEKNFVWTVGSFMIDYCLEHSHEPDKVVQAINDGYLAWHGLALTTHTELMDPELLDYSLDIAKVLDNRFGKHTIAAKMTDVPSHTHAIVPYLVKHGLQYLHIGINESSKLVKIPSLCRLQYAGQEIVLNYAGDYGKPEIFGEIALEFAHTADNMGPPTVEGVRAEMLRLRQKYPNAEVTSATLNDFAAEVLKHKDELPVITEELGDTWIHGIATDPFKSAAYMELVRIKNEWKASAPNVTSSVEYQRFMRFLLLVCEHTWGLDAKKWLYDFRNWDKQSFATARQSDVTTMVDIIPAGEEITAFVMEQIRLYTGGELRGGYRAMEASWEEQRQYIYSAVAELPRQYSEAAEQRFAKLRPSAPHVLAENTEQRDFEISGRKVRVLDDGSLQLLCDRSGKHYPNAFIGKLVYNVYSADTVNANYNEYNRNHDTTRGWSMPDFAKPGMTNDDSGTDASFAYTVSGVTRSGGELTIALSAPELAATRYGAPREAVIRYSFGEQIEMELQWFDKDMNRMPEAIFVGFNLGFTDGDELTVTKLGMTVKPYHVREGGNRKLHACTGVHYGSTDITNLDSPLLSVGGMHLYDTDAAYGDITQGMYFLLYNNRWNTNFPMWYGENASFRYIINLD